MKKKNIISLMISLSFLTLSITGILVCIRQKAHFVSLKQTKMKEVTEGISKFQTKDKGLIKSGLVEIL